MVEEGVNTEKARVNCSKVRRAGQGLMVLAAPEKAVSLEGLAVRDELGGLTVS